MENLVDKYYSKAVIDVTLKDVWGGDGAVRPYEIETKRNIVSSTKTIEVSTMPDLEPPKRERTETEVEKRKTEINTFYLDEKRRPIFPIARKIDGMFRFIPQALRAEKGGKSHPIFPYSSRATELPKLLNVTPEWIILSEDTNWKNNGNYYLGEIKQIVEDKFGNKGFPSLFYDAFKEVKTQFTIDYPKYPFNRIKEQIEFLVYSLQKYKTFNKHQTRIIVDKITWK